MPATTQTRAAPTAPAARYTWTTGAELAQLVDRLALQATQGAAPAGIIELSQARPDGTRSTYRLQPDAHTLAAFRGRVAPLIRAGLKKETARVWWQHQLEELQAIIRAADRLAQPTPAPAPAPAPQPQAARLHPHRLARPSRAPLRSLAAAIGQGLSRPGHGPSPIVGARHALPRPACYA